MAHDVLISYSSHDKLQADAICNRLESRGIRCWIAPRDVGLGEYAENIVEAIEQELEEVGFGSVARCFDLAQRPRVVGARWPGQ